MMHVQRRGLERVLDILEEIETLPISSKISKEMEEQEMLLLKIGRPIREAKKWVEAILNDL